MRGEKEEDGLPLRDVRASAKTAGLSNARRL